MQPNLLLSSVVELAKKAGAAITTFYRQSEDIKIYTKSDQSPLTETDLAAHEVISHGLNQLTPALPILSEESAAIEFSERQKWQCYWLIDPLDGTKEFIERTNEFTVNIALIENHKAILGVVYAPILDLCYFAAKGYGSFKQQSSSTPERIYASSSIRQPIQVVASRRHGVGKLPAFLDRLGDYSVLHVGSALKSCYVADGQADIYPRFGATSEWDTAAAQCVVEEAGGGMMDLAGNKLRYNEKASLVNPEFLVVGDVNYKWLEFLE